MYILKLYKNEEGFTLIELVLASALFSILALTVTILLSYTIKINAQLTDKSSKLENARIAMDFIQTNIESAERYSLNQFGKFLVLDKKDGFYFKFNNRAKEITYGDNLLSENIENISLNVTNDIMCIQIIMKSSENHELLKIIGQLSVKYKEKF